MQGYLAKIEKLILGLVKLPSGDRECHRTLLMISQHYKPWTNVDQIPSYHIGKLVNSLAPGRCSRNNFTSMIFKLITQNSCLDSLNVTGLSHDTSTLVQVMAWCCQTTSHYLSQCWHRSMSPYGVTRPQLTISMWIKDLRILREYALLCFRDWP